MGVYRTREVENTFDVVQITGQSDVDCGTVFCLPVYVCLSVVRNRTKNKFFPVIGVYCVLKARLYWK
jgi:hypothetical protein